MDPPVTMKALLIFLKTKTADLRILETRGFSMATTKIKEGRKMPTVATTAPEKPYNCQPINVAVDRTGPGVNCPTAIV